MAKLSLKTIIDIQVNLAAKAAKRKGFNMALILGKSNVIPESERVRIYTSADALLEDGFKSDSAEYKAAKLYFSATLAPSRLAVGIQVTKDKDKLAAAQACRAANGEWYVLIPLGATDKEIEALADWVENAQPDTLLAYTTSSKNNLSNSQEDAGEEKTGIFEKLKKKSYRRSFGLYCAQGDTPDAVAAVIGYAMGANRGTNNSSYTLAYKRLPGVTPDNLTEAQVTFICGSMTAAGNNGNVYVCRAEEYNILQQGCMADGTSFDEILNIDMLKNDIMLNVMDLLTSTRKVPQTEGGVASIVNVINVACNKYVNTGFIAPGKWNGGEVLNLENGDYLASGYLVQSEPIDSQSQADRDARKAPPIYVCVKLAGAIEFVTIDVYVNR